MKTAKIEPASSVVSRARQQCKRKFLFYFKKGYKDPTYIAWEREYKWSAHLEWERQLGKRQFLELLNNKRYEEIALRAVRIESRTNLLFSFEKMALRDGVKTAAGAKTFASGLFEYVYGKGPLKTRFELFTQTLEELPRRQTRVLTWPLHTVFGMIGNPDEHIFLKPNVTRIAARKYAFDFDYRSRPNWNTYQSLMDFAGIIQKNTADLKPKDFIDLQSFIWVMGSEEYPD